MSGQRDRGGESDPGLRHEGEEAGYRAFFDCFNAGEFFAAHEVLERVWLPARGTPDGRFYQGLIQLAGAFVHLEKQRPAPAGRLFRLAQANLARYPGVHRGLGLAPARGLILSWLARLEQTPDALQVGTPAERPRLPHPALSTR